jgi:hypothetical protein
MKKLGYLVSPNETANISSQTEIGIGSNILASFTQNSILDTLASTGGPNNINL